MKPNELFAWAGNGFTYILTVAQTNEIFQIISLVLAVITSAVLLCYRIWKWYKEAKADGTITKDEIKEGAKIVADGITDIKDKISDYKKEDKKDDKIQ